MYSAIKGIYENGKIRFAEAVPPVKRSEVLITFLKNTNEEAHTKTPVQGIRLGSLQGKLSIPDNFNEPLEDLKDYM